MHSWTLFAAQDLIVFPPLFVIAMWLRLSRADKKQAITIAILGAIITAALAVLGSHIFHDPRPFIAGHFTPYFTHSNDNGFPSDHTLFASLCAAIVTVYDRRRGALVFMLAALIGGARVIAGVHHMTDIIGGLLFAIIGVSLAELIIKRRLAKA